VQAFRKNVHMSVLLYKMPSVSLPEDEVTAIDNAVSKIYNFSR